MTLFSVTLRQAILVSLAFHMLLLFMGERFPFSKPTPFPRAIDILLVSSNKSVEPSRASDQIGAKAVQTLRPKSGVQMPKVLYQRNPTIRSSPSIVLPRKPSLDLKENTPLTEDPADTISMGDMSTVSSEEVGPVTDEVDQIGSGYLEGLERGLSEGTLSSGQGTTSVPRSSAVFIPLAHITRMPVFKRRVAPIYPEEARRLGKEGVVLLEVGISEEGKVIQVTVVQPIGYGFDEAAKTAMVQSEFEPAWRGEVPVAVIVRMPIRFRFKD